jgi:hypothetical protein
MVDRQHRGEPLGEMGLAAVPADRRFRSVDPARRREHVAVAVHPGVASRASSPTILASFRSWAHSQSGVRSHAPVSLPARPLAVLRYFCPAISAAVARMQLRRPDRQRSMVRLHGAGDSAITASPCSEKSGGRASAPAPPGPERRDSKGRHRGRSKLVHAGARRASRHGRGGAGAAPRIPRPQAPLWPRWG